MGEGEDKTPAQNRAEMEAILSNMHANSEHIEMMVIESAKMLHQRYVALIAAGFGEQQAFEIIKARGLT